MMALCLLIACIGSATGAQTASVPSGRLEARGAVVYDRETLLLWQRCSVGQQWTGGHCSGRAKTFTWYEARKLNEEGWRLPTITELRSLIDPDRKSRKLKPFIDLNAFPDLPLLTNEQNRPFGRFFWSSTARNSCMNSEQHIGCAEYVEFDTDLGEFNVYVVDMPRSQHFFVRLVRSAPQTSSPTEATRPLTSTTSADGRFVLNGSEALDHQTGLIWQRCDAGQQVGSGGLGCLGLTRLYPMEEALQLGGNDWRLPTLNELKTLLDRKRQQRKQRPLIDPTVFIDVDEHSDVYWTSTPYGSPRDHQVYCISFSYMYIENCGTYPQHARLVRRSR